MSDILQMDEDREYNPLLYWSAMFAGTVVIVSCMFYAGLKMGYNDGYNTGYETAANEAYEYPLDTWLEFQPYHGMVLHSTYADFLSMYRPIAAPVAK